LTERTSLLSLGSLALNEKLLLIWEDLSRADDFAGDIIIAGGLGGAVPPGIDFDDVAVTVEVLPEPVMLAMMGIGGLVLARRRRT